MIRIAISLITLICLLVVPASISAFSYTETITDNGIATPGFNYISTINFTDGLLSPGVTGTWGHSLSSSYMVVPDNFVVANATLQIVGWHAGVGGQWVEIGGEFIYNGSNWELTPTAYVGLTDVTSINSTFWNASPLEISLTPTFQESFNLSSATLFVDYDLAPGSIATPEPASLLLMGLGLVGAPLLRRRKK